MRRRILQLLPSGLVDALRVAKARLAAGHYYVNDWGRFARSYPVVLKRMGIRELQARLVFHSHAIEKGLSHTDLRYGFGSTAISALVQIMTTYSSRGYPKTAESYQCALSVLGAYLDAHSTVGPAPEPAASIPQWVRSEITGLTNRIGGVLHAHSGDSQSTRDGRSFADVMLSRHSIREFGSAPVSEESLRSAILMATRAPSVCNRQGTRVRIVAEPAAVSRLKTLQGGLAGYPDPPVMLVLTADLRDFLGPTERNQPFVDGGLFGMALLLALENVGLAACPLHAMLDPGTEGHIRRLLEVPDCEVFVFLVAVGTKPERPVTPMSFRYGLDRIVIDAQHRGDT